MKWRKEGGHETGSDEREPKFLWNRIRFPRRIQLNQISYFFSVECVRVSESARIEKCSNDARCQNEMPIRHEAPSMPCVRLSLWASKRCIVLEQHAVFSSPREYECAVARSPVSVQWRQFTNRFQYACTFCLRRSGAVCSLYKCKICLDIRTEKMPARSVRAVVEMPETT